MKQPDHILESIYTMVAVAPVLKWGSAAIAAIGAYFLPTESLQQLAMSAFGAVLLDTVTGVIAARSSKDPITSAKLSRLMSKLIGYSSAVILCTIVPHNLPGMDGLAGGASTAVLTMVLVTEALSVIENLDRMGVKFPAFIRDALKKQEEKE
jgi:phage-related holin